VSIRRILTLACVACAGCSLLTSLDGLSSGGADGDAGGGADAARADADRPDVVGITDGDAGAATDTGSDAAPTRRFCETVDPGVAMCEDFDDGQSAARWTPRVKPPGVTVGVFPGAQSPLELISRLGDPNGGDRWASYLRRLTGTVGHVRWSYDVMLVSPPTSGATEVNNMRLSAAGGSFDIYLEITPNRIQLQEQRYLAGMPGEGGDIVDVELEIGKWTRLSIEATVDGPDKRVRVLQDGKLLTDKALVFPLAGVPELQAGFSWATGGAKAEVKTDNLVFEILP
jgi:hypothetical protein